jgi:hypothetical protein
VQVGHQVALEADMQHAHLFDSKTGEALF